MAHALSICCLLLTTALTSVWSLSVTEAEEVEPPKCSDIALMMTLHCSAVLVVFPCRLPLSISVGRLHARSFDALVLTSLGPETSSLLTFALWEEGFCEL